MMPEIPKSARELLAKQSAAEPHPSPDLLNGYVEQALSEAEKKQVLMHLAACADCREVVFLAGGAIEEEEVEFAVAAAAKADVRLEMHRVMGSPAPRVAQPGPVVPPRPRRMWWKWAMPLVAMVVVASAVVIERDWIGALFLGHRTPTQVWQSSGPVEAIRVPPAQNTPEPSEPAAVAPETSSKMAGNAPASHNPPRARSAQPKDSTQDILSAEKQAEDRDKLVRRAQEAAKPESGTSAKSSAVRPAPPPPTAGAPNTVEVTSEAQGAVAELSNSIAITDTTKQSLAKSALPSSEPLANPALPAPPAIGPLHWRITADGHLERMASSNGRWTRVLKSLPVTFRVVSSVGRNVWAGGDNGTLYHSGDGGENWNKVALGENGTITSIHFDSAHQGSVTSDSGSVWVTTDGGITWSKQ